ncbi:MAG: DUF5343 domain-containing protein [Gemmatimonadales bacterium]|nr:DUF5343 domain-containing protein [Gemmatimonadales bacterium]
MPIRSGSEGPYAPPAAVLGIIRGFRNRGLSTPFTTDVLIRAGVSDSLAPRTMKSLKVLELIDEDGNPTEAFEGLRRATSDEYRPRLSALLKGVYQEVFNFADPATDTAERVADAFRAFNPIGQRNRMVSLFLGLCEEAGIPVPETRRVSVTTPSKPKATAKPPKQGNPVAALNAPSFRADKANLRNTSEETLHPAIGGMLASLPGKDAGWTQAQRDKWMTLFEGVLDFAIPVRESAPAAEPSMREMLEG